MAPPIAASIATLEPVLKTVYDKQATVLAFEMHALLGQMPKVEKFGGKNFQFGVRYQGGQGRSANFTKAQNNRNPNAYDDFLITRFSDYGVGSITGEAIEAAEGDINAMVEGLQAEIDGLFETSGQSASTALYRNGSGTIGQGATLLDPVTLQLADPTAAMYFGKGMTVGSSPTDGSGPQNVGTVKLAKIDEQTGTLTAEAPGWAAGIAGFAATDFLFVDGDYNAKAPGLLGWIPPVAPTTGDNFYGVDRSVDVVKLAGMRIDGGGAPLEETWQKAMALAQRFSAKIDKGYMHPEDLSRLTISLGSQVRRIDAKATDARVGYAGVEVVGPTGPVQIFGDADCPKGRAWGLKMSTWEYKTLGKMPRFLDHDGLRILREATADAYEFRIGYRGAPICRSPKDNISITWLSL